MIRVPRSGFCLLVTIACLGRSRLPAATPRHHAHPHDRAAIARAATGRASEASD